VARDTSGPLFAWVKLIVEPPLAFGFSRSDGPFKGIDHAQIDPYRPKETATPGFAVTVLPDTHLGLAILIGGSDIRYEPVAVVVTVDEAREVAKNDIAPLSSNFDVGRERVFAGPVLDLGTGPRWSL